MFQINGNLDLGKWMGWEKWLWLILSKVVGSLRAPSVLIILSYCRFLIYPFSNKLFSDRGLFWSWIIWLGVQACMERKTATKMRWTTCNFEFLDHPSSRDRVLENRKRKTSSPPKLFLHRSLPSFDLSFLPTFSGVWLASTFLNFFFLQKRKLPIPFLWL